MSRLERIEAVAILKDHVLIEWYHRLLILCEENKKLEKYLTLVVNELEYRDLNYE
jgi:hypothetical protein